METDLLFKPAGELAALIRDGELTSRELVETSLERIEALEPELNAFVHLDPDGALAAADAVGPGDDRPFAGVPIAIKDTAAVAGMALHAGLGRCSASFVPGYDAFVVRRLREAGFVLVGKTRPARVRDPARNRAAPLRPDAQPVGHRAHARAARRGGAAAAVAAGMRAGRPRQRRRRLDPHPSRLLRPRGAQAGARARSRAGPTRATTSSSRTACSPARWPRRPSCWTCWPATSPATPPGRRRRPSRSPRRPSREPGRLRIGLTIDGAIEAELDPLCERGAARRRRAARLARPRGRGGEAPWAGQDLLQVFTHGLRHAHRHGHRSSAASVTGREPSEELVEPLSWTHLEPGIRERNGARLPAGPHAAAGRLARDRRALERLRRGA